MSDRLREGRATDMFKSAASGLGNFFGKSNKTEEPDAQDSPTTNQSSDQSAVKQPSNQNDATTASKQAKGTSADKGGGRVQPKAGLVDVRRATYGKMMLALQTAGITDQQKQKEYAEQIITNIIIPFLTVHLNARGLNVTDLRSKKSSLSQNSTKDQSGNPRVVTLSEKKASARKINQSNNTQQTPEQKAKSEKKKELNRTRDQERVAAKQSRSTNDNSSKDAEEEVDAPAVTDEQQLNDVARYIESKVKEIKNANNLRDLYKIVNKMPDSLDILKKQYLDVVMGAFRNPDKFINNEDEKTRVTRKGGFRDKVFELAKKLLNKEQEPQAAAQPAEQADALTNSGQETQSLKNYSDQLNKIDKKVFPKELGPNPVLILSKLFAANPELAKEFGFKQEIKEVIDNEIENNYRGDLINDQPAKLLKALAKQNIKINIIQARNLAKSIISLNPQQVKSAKQVNRTPIKSQQQDATPAATDEQQLKDARTYIESKAEEIKNANTLIDLYKIVYKMPEIGKIKDQYLMVVAKVNRNPADFINTSNVQELITRQGGFRDKVLELARKKLAEQPQTQQSNQPAAQAPVALIPTTPEAQAIVKTKIDINQPIPLFTGNASLLQRINTSIKSRAKGVNINDPNIQNQFKQIIKDLVDQLKINGITNKQIQENFDFTQELLNETIVNRWKLLANIK